MFVGPNRHTNSYHDFSEEEITDIRAKLLAWYDNNQRQMPWRKLSANFVAKLKEKGEEPSYKIPTGADDDTLNRRAYAVLVSEIMLQQTQ